jgi:uncharacterized protein
VKRSSRSIATFAARCLRALFTAPILAYQRLLSPALPRRCKYYPTCSEYALEAVRELGLVRGSILAGWRLARCNPFSHGGYDPVENRTLFRSVDSTQPARRRTRERASVATGDSNREHGGSAPSAPVRGASPGAEYAAR